MKVYRPVANEFPITSPFGLRKDPITGQDASHYGVDFGVPIGTPVVAAVTGKIDAAGYEDEYSQHKGFGLRVRQYVQAEGKVYFVYYGHLSQLAVSTGEWITAGTRIGLSGNTGKTSGPHLHFEVRPLNSKGVKPDFIES